MKRPKRTRVAPPPAAPAIDPHEEVTTVDLLHSVKAPSGTIQRRIMCCDGIGFATGLVEPPFVTPCWCPAGLRMQCAVAEEAWPLHLFDAVRIANRLGLARAAA